MPTPTFSAVVVAHNEAQHIRECFEHLLWCEERILIDMESTDGTRDLVADLATHVLRVGMMPHMEFARNRGIDAASGDWIMVADADEFIPAALAARLRDFVQRAGAAAGVWLPRMNYSFGRPIRYAVQFPDYQLRLFRRGSGYYPDRLHSHPEIQGPALTFPVEEGLWIVHRRQDSSVGEIVRKWDTYAEKEAETHRQAGGGFRGPRAALWAFVSAFRFRFFTSRGYRDGMAGLALSMMFAFYRFERELKLWEQEGYDSRWDAQAERLASPLRLAWELLTEGVGRLVRHIRARDQKL